MAEYSVKVNNSNFLDISTGQQKFLILSDRRDPIVGDTLLVTNRNSPDELVKVVITSFEIEANGIESGFVIASIDLDLKSKETIKSQEKINKKINELESEILTLKEQKIEFENERNRLLDTIANLDKKQDIINQPNEKNDNNHKELIGKYNSICNRYNELDSSNTTLKKQYHELSKETDGLRNEISELTTESTKQKNDLSRKHNIIEGLKFQLNKTNDEKSILYKRNDELANSNSSLTDELHKIANMKSNEHAILTPLPNEYVQLKTLTKNLLSYIDSNL